MASVSDLRTCGELSKPRAQRALLKLGRHASQLLMRLYPRQYILLWHSCPVHQPRTSMNLVVASHYDRRHMRFDVEGRWRNGDALKLAYMVKAAVARLHQEHVLIDLRRVATPPDADGKFLICDRLRRALTHKTRVVLVATTELVDDDHVPQGLPLCPDIALFGAEGEALRWLGLQ